MIKDLFHQLWTLYNTFSVNQLPPFHSSLYFPASPNPIPSSQALSHCVAHKEAQITGDLGLSNKPKRFETVATKITGKFLLHSLFLNMFDHFRFQQIKDISCRTLHTQRLFSLESFLIFAREPRERSLQSFEDRVEFASS